MTSGMVQPRSTAARRRRRIADVLGGYVPMVLMTLVVFLPLGWMMLSAMKMPHEIVTINPKVLPEQFTLENYRRVAESVPIWQFFGNSVLITTIASTVKLTLAITTAYAVVFVRFPLKNVIFMLVLVALMVPTQVAMVPNYLLISGWGGRNTYWGIILPGLGTAFGTFLLRQHFKSLPPSVLEAAEIDGAGHFQRLWRMVVPMSAPAIATVGLVTIVQEWNDYIWPLIITDSPARMTLPVGLTLLQNTEGDSDWGVLMAGAVLVILPVLVVFALLQRHIVSGLTAGSVTG